MFHWQLNGSERSYASPGAPSGEGRLTSKYTFVGTLDKDYGSLLCWANNTIGTQEEACIFNIIPAGEYFISKNNLLHTVPKAE